MVRADPVGVHAEPTAELVHASLVPIPGAMLCRSKTIVPAEVTNVAKLLMTRGPGADMSGRLWMTPLESPAKDPVLELPGASGLAGVLVPAVLKKTPVAFRVRLPEALPEPVMVWAGAGAAEEVMNRAVKVSRE